MRVKKGPKHCRSCARSTAAVREQEAQAGARGEREGGALGLGRGVAGPLAVNQLHPSAAAGA